MALHVLIDGYNLIRQSPELSLLDARDIQDGRNALLTYLAKYKKVKGHKITVVFDGWKGSGTYRESKEIIKGINVIFSPLGVEADDIIKRLARKNRERAVVVSSDRDITDFAETQQATSMSSQDFLNKLHWAMYSAEKGGNAFQESNNYRSSATGKGTKKKGPAKRKPKKARRGSRKINKL